jgi:hypothetical protein
MLLQVHIKIWYKICVLNVVRSFLKYYKSNNNFISRTFEKKYFFFWKKVELYLCFKSSPQVIQNI